MSLFKIASKKRVSIGSKTAMNAKEKIGGEFVTTRLIEANRKDIGLNVVRNEEFF